MLLKSIQDHDFESELSLYFNDNPNKYIIIICEDHCSFQRCGTPKEVNGEYNYESLDELYKAQQIDGIVLLLDVNKTEYILKFTRNYYTAAGNAIIQACYSSIITRRHGRGAALGVTASTLQKHIKASFADGTFYPGKWKHYDVYTQSCIIDVVSLAAPKVSRK